MAQESNTSLRNIAIISHVDHGKTTLVDAIFRQSGLFRADQEVDDRLMDNMDLERERGITITAKNCSVMWEGVRINIIDTPGHTDFGGEVERALSMADGAVLLVDACEGPLPQTRFVLSKALEAGLPIITVINKMDRPDGRIDEVLEEIYDLFIELGADESQLEFPVLYAIGKEGVASFSPRDAGQDLRPLFGSILQNIPAPVYDPEMPLQVLISDIGYSDFVGRLAVGKVTNGEIRLRDSLVCVGENGEQQPVKISKLQVYQGTEMRETTVIKPGDIAVMAGLSAFYIGDTICQQNDPRPLPRISVDRPTVGVRFVVNDSPLSGREGKFVQFNRIRERLEKEVLGNVAIALEETKSPDTILVHGRGEFQLSILIETMRREGYEFSVGRPEVLYRWEDGQQLEPMERLVVDCEEQFMGVVTEKLSLRKAQMLNMTNNGQGRVRIEFSIPARGLIGYRDEFLTDTRGSGLMHSRYDGYSPVRGPFPERYTGSIVSDRSGQAVPYALFNLEPRGQLFVQPGDQVYEGMIVGEHNRDQDIDVNPCKAKKLTNVRSSGKDDQVTLTPIKPLSLELAISFIREDELLEVTPHSLRMRKLELSCQKRHAQRSREAKREKMQS